MVLTVPGANSGGNLSGMKEPVSDLVRRATAGDTDSFTELLLLFAPRAFRAAAAILGEPQEAEDAVQEGSIVAFQKIGQLRDGEAFGSWFMHIVVSKAIDLLRKRKREQNRVAALSTSPNYQNATPQTDHETAMDIVQAVEQLPVKHRTVIRLYYGAGHTTPEIARMLDRPEGTVRRLLSEAYKMLRPLLEPASHEDEVEK